LAAGPIKSKMIIRSCST